MRKTVFAILSFFALTGLTAEETPAKEEPKQPSIQQLSEAFGHMIAKNLDSLGFELDMQQVMQGFKDSLAGKEPNLSETETVQAITHLEEEKYNKQCSLNLIQAEDFLATNAQKEDVISVDDGKLQYTIAQKGSGAVVEPHFSPLIQYTGRHIDGKEFGASQEPEALNLDETIPGFAKGIAGMKEGEKRTLYIHPELGYGTSGAFLPPNSLLIFDIEVVQANAPVQDENDNHSDDEIALDLGETPAVR